MSCQYLPNPPRVWSRVQSYCTYTDPSSNYEYAYVPIINKVTTQGEADALDKIIYKGNILQYKANSANLTKSQRYAQLAKGFGPNRRKVFATQSQTYTNPNTSGLLRENYTTYNFPNDIVGAPNNISGPFAYGIPNPNGCAETSIQDGGTLVCGIYVNPCSGEIIKDDNHDTDGFIFNPASASNVPGTTALGWTDKMQTWYPRQRYFMNNSGTKWPEGYKEFVSAVTPAEPPIPSIYIEAIYNNNDLLISWKPNFMFKIDSIKVYINQIFYKQIDNNNTYNFLLENVDNNSFISITSLIGTKESGMSNSVYFNTSLTTVETISSMTTTSGIEPLTTTDEKLYTVTLTSINTKLDKINANINNNTKIINNNTNQRFRELDASLNNIGLSINQNIDDLSVQLHDCCENMANMLAITNNSIANLDLSMNKIAQNTTYNFNDIKNLIRNTATLLDNSFNYSISQLDTSLQSYIENIKNNAINIISNLFDQQIINIGTIFDDKCLPISEKIDNISTSISDLRSETIIISQMLHNLDTYLDASLNYKLEVLDISFNLYMDQVQNNIINAMNNALDNQLQLFNDNLNYKCDSLNMALTDLTSVASDILTAVLKFRDCCCCDASCNCDVYNTFYTSETISQINNYVMTYMTTAYETTDIYIPAEEYDMLKVGLVNLEGLFDPSCCFLNIIDIYRNLLTVVKTAFDSKNLAQTTLLNAETWRQDSITLHDTAKLKEYLELLNKSFRLLNLNITATKATLKPQYQRYHDLYGVPANLEYDPYLMKAILDELGIS